MKPEDRRPRRIPNPQVFDVAEQYYRAYRYLDEPGSSTDFLPRLQLAAIALELYLKCLGAEDVYKPEDPRIPGLYTVHAKAVRNHKLVKNLLQRIPADTKNRLTDASEANSLSQQEGFFEQLLDRFEDLLVTSRYPFEEGCRVDCYPLSSLPDLLRFLRKFIHAEMNRQTSDY